MTLEQVQVGWLRRVSLSKLESRLVWIVGSPRTGSTWLADLLADDRRCVRIPEPLIGLHLGVRSSALGHLSEQQLVDKPRIQDLRSDPDYFFSAERSAFWSAPLRKLILRRFSAYLKPAAQAYIIHEPNGSDGVDTIMRCLPNSRMLFLMRDPRDVIDSILDAYRTDSWAYTAFGVVGRELTPRSRVELIENEAYRWLTRTQVVQNAFDGHEPRLRHFLRYEDLLAGTSTELAKIVAWLGLMPVTDLEERVARHSFAAVPPENTGPGKFHRSASPGLWMETWTAEEKRVCGAIVGRALQHYGYAPTDT